MEIALIFVSIFLFLGGIWVLGVILCAIEENEDNKEKSKSSIDTFSSYISGFLTCLGITSLIFLLLWK